MNKQNFVQFFLGLLEGDGSIQVNHWRKRSLQYRIVIKLAYSEANYNMLSKLSCTLGIMNIHIRKNEVLMIEDHTGKLLRIMHYIDTYGLLLSHKRRQYAFFKYCFQNRIPYSEYKHIKSLGLRWSGFDTITDAKTSELVLKPHWANWLCGFTEAEGCFCVRQSGSHSFSIAQKDGQEIMQSVKMFFNAPNKIRQTSRVHLLETYASTVLRRVVSFYDSSTVVGLLGQKRVQLEKFKNALQAKHKTIKVSSDPNL
jgi:LAGLIDADG endonuclease